MTRRFRGHELALSAAQVFYYVRSSLHLGRSTAVPKCGLWTFFETTKVKHRSENSFDQWPAEGFDKTLFGQGALRGPEGPNWAPMGLLDPWAKVYQRRS